MIESLVKNHTTNMHKETKNPFGTIDYMTRSIELKTLLRILPSRLKFMEGKSLNEINQYVELEIAKIEKKTTKK